MVKLFQFAIGLAVLCIISMAIGYGIGYGYEIGFQHAVNGKTVG